MAFGDHTNVSPMACKGQSVSQNVAPFTGLSIMIASFTCLGTGWHDANFAKPMGGIPCDANAWIDIHFCKDLHSEW